MKRIHFWSLLLVLTLALGLFAGCESTPEAEPQPTAAVAPVTTDNISEAIDTLLTRDYIVSYLWYCDGLAAEGEPVDDYSPVSTASGYTSLADLRALVENTYSADAAASLMDAADTQGRPRFIEGEGKLMKSTHPVLSAYYWDYDAESVTILSQEGGTVLFTVNMTNLMASSDAEKTVEMSMQREGGAWKLSAVSVLLAEGGELPGAATAGTRELAERFLVALTENDTASIAECAGEQEDAYASWSGMSIPAATLSETLEEYDGYGRYRVHMKVQNAFGVFGKGEENYLLIVTVESDNTPVVCYFEPEDKVSYNYSGQKDDAACAMTEVFLQYEGYQKFKGSFWMDNETATDFAMAMLTLVNPAQSVYTAEEITAAAKLYLGFNEFTPSDSEKFLAEEGGYLLPGRSMTLGQYLIWPSYSDGAGRTLVKVEKYSDHLNTKDCVSYLFTYKTNADGSLCLLSIT